MTTINARIRGFPHPSTTITTPEPNSQQATTGVIYALLAYGWWGTIVPLYFARLGVVGVDAFEAVASRIVWGLPVLFLLITLGRSWRQLRDALRDPRTLRVMLLSTAFIVTNWTGFVYAMVTNRALEASLGYFINPMVSVMLGMFFLGERLRPLQWAGLIVATCGVGYMTYAQGHLPWLSLMLAFSFGFYGLVRKRATVGPVVGLTIEMLFLLVPSIALLVVYLISDRIAFYVDGPEVSGLLVLAGIVTVLPLVWFTAAARRLKLATVGFLQYIAPTGQFLIAVLILKEPWDTDRLIAFGLIWVAVILYSIESIRRMRSTAS